MAKKTLEDRMAAELSDLLEVYQNAPPQAKSMKALQALFPSLPEKVLRDRIAKWVAEGKWKRTRSKSKAHELLYWPAEKGA